jgi:RNA polymerase sporulation-specific sigma factor
MAVQVIPFLSAAEEANLIEQVKSSDPLTSSIAFEKFLRCFEPLISSYARQIYNVGSDRPDVEQELHIGLFKAVKGFRSDRGTRLSTYARKYLNGVIQHIKRQRAHKAARERAFFEQELDLIEYRGPSLEMMAVEDSICRAKIKRIREFIESLPDPLKRVAQRRYYDGKTAAQTARDFNISRAAVCKSERKIKNLGRTFLSDLESVA